MKDKHSLFKRYLRGHFLFIFLPPITILLFLMFFEVPAISEEDINKLNQLHGVLIVFTFIIVAFFIMSWFFFTRLRKRLTRLQTAMKIPEQKNILPSPVLVKTELGDEIDELGQSFNWMIEQLEESRKREVEEEALRRKLIANVSHDLRTPLTIIRGHVTKLNKETLSVEGKKALKETDKTITRVDELLNDLFTYTLVTSNKLSFNPVSTDMVRFVRAITASWYPVFEEQGFQIDIDLSEKLTFYWKVDPKWVTRVFDNLFQNILRHAEEGKYVCIHVDIENERLMIKDKGPGMEQSSYENGAGIGLSTLKYLLEKMQLTATFHSNFEGTAVIIEKKHQM